VYDAGKDPQWYAVQGSDTTMLTRAASLVGQKKMQPPVEKKINYLMK